MNVLQNENSESDAETTGQGGKRAAEDTGSRGLELRLVAKEQHVSLFKGLQETETLSFFDTVSAAQEA